MEDHESFKDRCIVSCGMLYPELKHLMETGFLDPYKISFTPPGLHAIPDDLERHLVKRLERAKEFCSPEKIIVLYGKRCYVNVDEPSRRVDTIIEAQGKEIKRIQADYGYDMLAGIEKREELSGDEAGKTLWFTAGWLKNWKTVYQRYFGWDRADANANFPGYYNKIIVLDGIGISNRYLNDYPEKILELFDWTALEVEFREISLERLKKLLLECL